jgi:16S rRNA processing protein RimM
VAEDEVLDQSRVRMLVLGHVSGLFGVRGWVRVFSETEPRENILGYQPWYLGGAVRPTEVAGGRRHGKGVVARLGGCVDRDQAARLVGLEIAVRRDQLPTPGHQEYYWADLEGLAVETLEGVALGRVTYLMATSANDVLVIEGERQRLVPFLWRRVVQDVNLDRGVIRVDWDPDF